MAHRLGIDVGNTFTDLLLLDDSGAAHALKTPNRPDDPVATEGHGLAARNAAALWSPAASASSQTKPGWRPATSARWFTARPA